MPPESLTNTDLALARAWHPVASVAEVPADRPLRVMLLGSPWALVRLDGGLVAVPDRCPHRRVPLSAGRVVGSELECAYHGWRFDGSGACTAVPALGRAARVPPGMRVDTAWGVVERYGLVWVAPAEPLTPVPSFPECEDPFFSWAVLPERRTSASAGVVVDNFFDVAHFSYLHGQSFGVSEPVTVDEYELGRDGWQARLTHATTVREDLGGLRRVATYTMTPPFAMHLQLCFPDSGFTSMVAFVAVPETATSTLVRKLVAWPAAEGPEALAATVADEERILTEDLELLELLDDPALPLDPHAEKHTKADRASIELRRVLAEFCAAATG